MRLDYRPRRRLGAFLAFLLRIPSARCWGLLWISALMLAGAAVGAWLQVP